MNTNQYKVTYTVTGATNVAGYHISPSSSNANTFQINCAKGSFTYYTVKSLESGVSEVTFEITPNNSKTGYYVLAYNTTTEDTKTVVSSMSEAVGITFENVLSTVDFLNATATYGGTVTLKENVTLTAPINVKKGKSMTIKLGEFDITSASTDVFDVEGTLTIEGTDEAFVYAGTNPEETNGVCAVWAHNGGKVTIKGGYYKVGQDKNGYRNDCIYAGSNSEGTAGTITINGGTFKNHAPSLETTGTNTIALGSGKNVYNGETVVTGPHSGSEVVWYTVK